LPLGRHHDLLGLRGPGGRLRDAYGAAEEHTRRIPVPVPLSRFRFCVSEARVTVGLADVRVGEAARASKRSRMPYLLSLTDITSSRPRCGLAKRLLKCDLQ
jgi:hypothetical protein